MNRPAEGEFKKLICLSPRVIERIERLRKAGTTGVLLSEKAETVIEKLKSGASWKSGPQMAPCSQHGEKRIRKCIKYDLGWGHRLVTLLRGDILFICCLGTHDECDRWLEKNSRTKKFEMPNARVCCVAPREPEFQSSDKCAHYGEEDDLDRRLQELPDQSLRRIFCGLVEAQRCKKPNSAKLDIKPIDYTKKPLGCLNHSL